MGPYNLRSIDDGLHKAINPLKMLIKPVCICIFFLWGDFTVFSRSSKMTYNPLYVPHPLTTKFKNHCFKGNMVRDTRKAGWAVGSIKAL